MNEALDQKYLEHIAKVHKVNLLQAANLIDRCIKEICANSDLEYSKVYEIVFSGDMIKKCVLINNDCTKLELEECEKRCSCVYLEPYGCLPRKIPDADIINQNPDKYIMNKLSKTEDLKRVLTIAAYLYYNYDGGGLTDNSYDALEYAMKKKEKVKGRLLEKIGAMPVDKIRTELIYGMASQSKVKPGSIECLRFMSKFTENDTKSTVKPLKSLKCCWSLKLDGTSGQITYNNGKLISITTRGDGVIGGDVTYLKDYISSIPHKIPVDYRGDVVIRGEFILTKKVWESKYAGTYSNARAFVNGKINSGHITSAMQDILFLAYKIRKNGDSPSVPKPSKGFKMMVYWKFLIPDNGVLNASPTVFDVMQLYIKKRAEAEYTIDGLILAEDVSEDPVIAHEEVRNPINSVAFKMQLQEQIRDTTVIDMNWNVSRYGKLIPVAIFEAVYVDGVRITKALAFNARKVQDWNMGRGTKIKVARSGDVIPQIKDVTVDYHVQNLIPNLMLIKYHWEGKNIVLDDIEGNRDVHLKRIVYFFETLSVPRLRGKTVEKFYDAGFKTPEAITRATIKDMKAIKGIGDKTATFFYDTIRSVLSNTPPDRFIEASTTFKSGIGRKTLKLLFKHIPNVLRLSSTEITHTLTKNKIPGIGAVKIQNIATSIPAFNKYLSGFSKIDIDKSLDYYVNKQNEMKKIGYNSLISGKKFVLTGFMNNTDYELEDYIYDNNGDFADTVISSITAVICGSLEEVSKKMTTAYDFGIPVLSIQEFSERFNVPLKRFEKKDEEEDEEDD
jgi:DNA ligase (NAD+)